MTRVETQAPLDGDHLDRFERLEQIYRDLGFLPVTKTEQYKAFGLQSVLGSRVGQARHIQEVLRHQDKPEVNTNNPAAAGVSITRDFISWAEDARQAVVDLREKQAELFEDVNPKLFMDRVDDQPDPRLLPWLRFHSLQHLLLKREASELDYDPQDPKLKYTAENVMMMTELERALARVTVHELRTGLTPVIDHEQHRGDFWVDGIIQIEAHTFQPIRGIAQQAIARFSKGLTAG